MGAIVCCGVGGVLEHTGIWTEDNMIIEFDGNGLIKPISPTRFIKERSGKIFSLPATLMQIHYVVKRLLQERQSNYLPVGHII